MRNSDRSKKGEKGINSRPAISSIEQAARYSDIEINMGPGSASRYSEDSEYLVSLFTTAKGPTGWGISEKVVIDRRTDTPYWIVTQYDGQIAAQTWYLRKRKLSYDEVAQYAQEISQELYKKVRGINARNWKKIAEAMDK